MMINIMHHIKKRLKAWSENRAFMAILASVRQLFVTLLVTYLVLLLIDIFFPGSVSRYINLNYWLIAVIVTGAITVLSRQEDKTPKEQAINAGNIVTFFCIGIIGAGLIWYRTREIGWITYLISPAGGILIALLLILIRRKDGEEESEGENSPHS